MKKAFLLIFLSVVFAVLMLFSVSAQTETELPGESVYASVEKQAEIAQAFDEDDLNYLKNNKIWILTESITPVYYVDIWDYVETGEWKMHPTGYKDGKYYADKTAEETSVYRAKTTDYEGVFAGDITLHLTDSGVEIVEYKIALNGEKFSFVSFADHLVRLHGGCTFGTEKDSAKYYVFCSRYVMLGDLGSAFYVNREKMGYDTRNEYLVALELCDDRILGEVDILSGRKNSIIDFDTNMGDVVKYLKSVKWSENYPDKSAVKEYSAVMENGKNIVNITAHLENGENKFFTERDKLIGYTAPETLNESTGSETDGDIITEPATDVETELPNEGDEKQTANKTYILLTVVGICVVVLCGTIVFVRRSKKINRRNDTTQSPMVS